MKKIIVYITLICCFTSCEDKKNSEAENFFFILTDSIEYIQQSNPTLKTMENGDVLYSAQKEGISLSWVKKEKDVIPKEYTATIVFSNFIEKKSKYTINGKITYTNLDYGFTADIKGEIKINNKKECNVFIDVKEIRENDTYTGSIEVNDFCYDVSQY